MEPSKHIQQLMEAKENTFSRSGNPTNGTEFLTWRRKTAAALEGLFGINSRPVRDFEDFITSLQREPYGDERILSAVDTFLEEMIDSATTAEPEQAHISPTPSENIDKRRVFVVHGRNAAARDALFDFLRSIGLHPIEWSEAIAMTRTPNPYVGAILEKAFSVAQAIVVLMTGDDEVQLRLPFHSVAEDDYEMKLMPQARPNVLFEAGLAFGVHPDRTVLVELGKLRPFSDIGGRYTVRITNDIRRRAELAAQLRNAGCPVNLDGPDWRKTGDFDSALK